MSFGTADRRKADVAEVALAVGHVGTRHGNRLGLITFGDARPVTIPSRQGRAGLLGMLATVRRDPQLEGGGATSLGEALARTGRLASSRSWSSWSVTSAARGTGGGSSSSWPAGTT